MVMCWECPCLQSISGAKMFQIQFHSGFIDPGISDLVFGRYVHTSALVAYMWQSVALCAAQV